MRCIADSSVPDEILDDSLHSLIQRLKALKVDRVAMNAAVPKIVAGLEDAKVSLSTNREPAADTWQDVANTFQFCADASRQESVRTPIGSSQIVELIVDLLTMNKDRIPNVDVQAMRAFANACVDHELLSKTTHPDSIKTACGALLNATMSYEPAQKKAIELGAIEQLLKVLQLDSVDEHEVSMTIAARVIVNLSEIEEGNEEIIMNHGARDAILLLQKLVPEADSYLDLMDALVDILRAVSSKDSVQVFTMKEGLVPHLLTIVHDVTTNDEGKDEAEAKEDAAKLADIKAGLVEAIVSVSLSDANMVRIFNNKHIMDTFLSWLELEDREDLQTCAALCLGNVARSDQHCVKLVHEYHAIEPLIHVVRKAQDLKASHAATGVLRNLALPERNRNIMGNAGVIQACFPLLKKDNAVPLQSNVVGILKRLSNNHGHNVVRIISGREPFETLTSLPGSDAETPLSTLVDLIRRSDDFAMKSEGTRTICNLIKVTWSSEGIRDLDAASIRSLQQTLHSCQVVDPIAAMTRNPKFTILQNEGIIALTLLVTSSGGNSSSSATAQNERSNAVLDALISLEVTPQPDPETTLTLSEEPQEPQEKSQTLLESVLALIKNEKGSYADEIRTNACVFLRNAIDAAGREGENPAYMTFLKSSGIKDKLDEMIAQEDSNDSSKLRPLVRAAIQQVISRL
ncbi:hypothetical protein DFQ27_005735 [Actinomortierella ambigua]|uniref:ARM repeat-containing protein n=1 Tax=Actinomortierella ambigua TaxID=1343610 RepID=A0A9P6QL47_9FUNG|nr:hypothetical protein DFQ27_005735 [Actinomortierella ambigua]